MSLSDILQKIRPYYIDISVIKSVLKHLHIVQKNSPYCIDISVVKWKNDFIYTLMLEI